MWRKHAPGKAAWLSNCCACHSQVEARPAEDYADYSFKTPEEYSEKLWGTHLRFHPVVRPSAVMLAQAVVRLWSQESS